MMNINEAKEITGLAKKMIRFYEEAGLLSVKRDEKTGYREYDEESINTLKQIKLYRNIGVPIQEILAVMKGKSTVPEVLVKQLQELDGQIKSLQAKRELLASVIGSNKLAQNSAELIFDMEDIVYCGSNAVKEKLAEVEAKDIILAAMGSSPKVNEFLQKLLPELDIRLERQRVGQVRIEDVEEAQRKIIISMNR